MVLRVIAVKEPDPIVKFVITAYSPRKRFVRVAAKVAVVAIEIGKAMAKVPERHQETDVAPVENAEDDDHVHVCRSRSNRPSRHSYQAGQRFPCGAACECTRKKLG